MSWTRLQKKFCCVAARVSGGDAVPATRMQGAGACVWGCIIQVEAENVAWFYIKPKILLRDFQNVFNQPTYLSVNFNFQLMMMMLMILILIKSTNWSFHSLLLHSTALSLYHHPQLRVQTQAKFLEYTVELWSSASAKSKDAARSLFMDWQAARGRIIT